MRLILWFGFCVVLLLPWYKYIKLFILSFIKDCYIDVIFCKFSCHIILFCNIFLNKSYPSLGFSAIWSARLFDPEKSSFEESNTKYPAKSYIRLSRLSVTQFATLWCRGQLAGRTMWWGWEVVPGDLKSWNF